MDDLTPKNRPTTPLCRRTCRTDETPVEYCPPKPTTRQGRGRGRGRARERQETTRQDKTVQFNTRQDKTRPSGDAGIDVIVSCHLGWKISPEWLSITLLLLNRFSPAKEALLRGGGHASILSRTLAAACA